MVTRASLAGHPVHPLGVAVAVTLFAATVAALLAYVATANPFYYRGAMIASCTGVTAALLAVLPAALELAARRAGTAHALVAAVPVVAFAACGALLYRGGRASRAGELSAATLPLAVAAAGLVALVVVGALAWARAHAAGRGAAPARSHAVAGLRARPSLGSARRRTVSPSLA